MALDMLVNLNETPMSMFNHFTQAVPAQTTSLPQYQASTLQANQVQNYNFNYYSPNKFPMASYQNAQMPPTHNNNSIQRTQLYQLPSSSSLNAPSFIYQGANQNQKQARPQQAPQLRQQSHLLPEVGPTSDHGPVAPLSSPMGSRLQQTAGGMIKQEPFQQSKFKYLFISLTYI